MKKSLILTSLLVGAISFSGCGSSSSPDSTGNNGGSGGNGGSSNSSSLTPVTTKVVCDPKAITNEKGDSYDVKYAAEGDITVMCQKSGQYSYGEYQLVSGVSTLTITNIKKVEEYIVNTDKIKGKGISTYDYKAGTVHHQESGTFEGKTEKYDCVETYPSPLPTTLTDTQSIDDIFYWEGDENNRIKTTCPDSYYENDNDEDDNLGKGQINAISNYTLTDSNNKKHLITESIKMTFN